MNIVVLCKVIDNFGDAGFCLRLSRGLSCSGHGVWLVSDRPETVLKLMSQSDTGSLDLLDGRSADDLARLPEHCSLVIEPFGTSSESTTHRFDQTLRTRYHTAPWLVVDYLTAEAWAVDFHLSGMTQARTGHSSTLFYPGFGPSTGGLIHRDWPAINDRPRITLPPVDLQVLVFGYKHSPLQALMAQCPPGWQWAWLGPDLAWLNTPVTEEQLHRLKQPAWVPQVEFDDLLKNHDLLMVRGEDSFVRAQLSGKPFIWQIYPTEDGAHRGKLDAFFALYTAGWPETLQSAWRSVWYFWNGFSSEATAMNWQTGLNFCLSEWEELNDLSMKWSRQVRQWPDLVGEILTWRNSRDPTSAK